MRFWLILMLCFMISSIAKAQSPTDVDGWGKLKWGMTEEEVSSEFPGQIVPHNVDNGPGCGMTQRLEKQSIAGLQLNVIFNYACPTKTLKAVSLVPSTKWDISLTLYAFEKICL